MRKQGISNFARNALASALVLGAMAGSTAAFADADPFADAVTASTTKVTTYGAALVGLAAVGVAFGIGIKYVKRIKGAA